MEHVADMVAPYAFDAMVGVQLLMGLWILFVSVFGHQECLNPENLGRFLGLGMVATIALAMLSITNVQSLLFNQFVILSVIFLLSIVLVYTIFKTQVSRRRNADREWRSFWFAMSLGLFMSVGILVNVDYLAKFFQ